MDITGPKCWVTNVQQLVNGNNASRLPAVRSRLRGQQPEMKMQSDMYNEMKTVRLEEIME